MCDCIGQECTTGNEQVDAAIRARLARDVQLQSILDNAEVAIPNGRAVIVGLYRAGFLDGAEWALRKTIAEIDAETA